MEKVDNGSGQLGAVLVRLLNIRKPWNLSRYSLCSKNNLVPTILSRLWEQCLAACENATQVCL